MKQIILLSSLILAVVSLSSCSHSRTYRVHKAVDAITGYETTLYMNADEEAAHKVGDTVHVAFDTWADVGVYPSRWHVTNDVYSYRVVIKN